MNVCPSSSRRKSLLLALALIASAGCEPFNRATHKNPTDPDQEFLKLTTQDDRTTLRADGIDRMVLVAEIDRNADPRDIVFTTSAGTLVGAKDGTLTVKTDLQGRARAELVSEKRVTTALVTASVTGVDRVRATLSISFVPPDSTRVLRFLESSGSAPADGATATRITIELISELPVDQRSVKFTTTHGSFKQGDTVDQDETIAAGAAPTVSILLFSPLELANAHLAAEAAGFRDDRTLDFVRAVAESIQVDLDKVAISPADSNAKLAVVVTLRRAIGTPSAGTEIYPTALDVAGNPFGSFQNITRSDADGKATADFFPNRQGVRGPARIVVRAQDSSAVGEARFLLTRP